MHVHVCIHVFYEMFLDQIRTVAMPSRDFDARAELDVSSSNVRIPLGYKVYNPLYTYIPMYIAVLLSKLDIHCHCV
jgi:hypothetical protein